MRTRSMPALLGTIALVGATYGVRAMTEDEPIPAEPITVGSEPQPRPDFLPEITRLISLFEDRIAVRDDPLDYRVLGRHYLELGAATSDPDAYRDAAMTLSRSLELAPGQPDALVDLSVARMGIHDFAGALESIAGALSARPGDLRAQLILGDVLFALGRYGEAATQFDIVDAGTDADPGVLIRKAELAWHTGDNDGAIALSGDAVEAAIAAQVDRRSLAFYKTEHGHHLANNGRIEEAIHALEDAVATDLSWAAPRAELARAYHLHGLDESALENIVIALDMKPDIGWQTLLVDILVVQGDDAAAASAQDTLARLVEDAKREGAVYARPVALYLAEYGDAVTAVTIAKTEVETRADVYGRDLLAWALHQAGRTTEAWPVIEQALATGTLDPTILYHAGVIAEAAGNLAQGREYLSRALEINPYFDPIDAEDARTRLQAPA